jgi:hypothetical protein
MHNRLVYFLLGLLLAGCSADVTNNKDFRLSDQSDTGLVVVSLTYAGLNDDRQLVGSRYVDFRPVAAADSQAGGGQTGGSRIPVFNHKSTIRQDWSGPPAGKEIPQDQPLGRLVLLNVKPGQYEFYQWNGDRDCAGRHCTVTSTTYFSVKFEAVKGKATYAGELKLVQERSKYGLRIADRSDRDLPLLKQKAPYLTDEQVRVKLMTN